LPHVSLQGEGSLWQLLPFTLAFTVVGANWDCCHQGSLG
jgi:hypothetical protein